MNGRKFGIRNVAPPNGRLGRVLRFYSRPMGGTTKNTALLKKNKAVQVGFLCDLAGRALLFL